MEASQIFAEETFRKRDGTTDYGKSYEDALVALFTLILSTDSNVTDYRLSSNDGDFGIVDDIVFKAEFLDETSKFCALQVKYSKNKLKMSSLFFEKGDFSIKQIFEETKKLCLGHCNYILYTNRKMNLPENKVFFQIKNEERFQIKVIQTKIENDIINTSETKMVYRFEIDEDNLDPEFQNSEDFIKYQDFLKKFYLYVSQKDLKDVYKEISKIFKRCFGCEDENTVELYLKFIEKWSIREKDKKNKLSKKLTLHKIAECLLTPYIKCDFFSPTDKKLMFMEKKLIPNFEIILLSNVSCERVKSKKLEDEQMKKAKTIAKMYELFEDNTPLDEIKPLEEVKIMWHLNKFPLIVEIPASKEALVCQAVDLCEKRTFVLIGNISKERFTRWRVFENLGDLQFFESEYLKCHLHNRRDISIKRDWVKARIFDTNSVFQMIDRDLVIGKAVETPSFYVNRFIRKILIKFDIIRKLEGAIIIISCNGRQSEVEKYANKPIVNINFLPEDNVVRNSIIVAEKRCSKEYYHKLRSKFERVNIYHFGMVADNQLEWLSSSGNIKPLRKFLDKSINNLLVRDDQIFEHFPNNINIILADPGMGKSLVMTYIATIAPVSLWPIKIDFKFHHTFFQQEQHDDSKIVEHFVKTDDEITKKLFDIYKKRKAILFLWDGMDELTTEGVENAIKVIKKLAEMGYSQWIAGRRHLKEKLEQEFNVFALDLKQFDEEEQKRYIEARLQGKCKDINQTVSKILENVNRMKKREILGVPLHLFMLTEIYLQPTLQIDVTSLTLTKMYDSFLNGKFNFHQSKDCETLNALKAKQLKKIKNYKLRIYKEAALLSCCDSDVLQVLNIERENILNEFEEEDEYGIITKIADNVPIFVHHTYAEYLTAVYFRDNRSRVKDAVLLLFNDKYKTIRYMFDMLLAEEANSRCHLAVLHQDYENNLEEVCAKDSAGRNLLQLACCWGTKHSLLKQKFGKISIRGTNSLAKKSENFEKIEEIAKCVAEKCDPNEKDEMLKLNSFDYADRTLSLHLLEVILAVKNSDIDLTNLKNYSDVSTVLYYSIRFNYPFLFHAVTKSGFPFLETEEEGNNLLHLSIIYNRTEFLKKILEDREYLSKINNDNKQKMTPLHAASKNGRLDYVKILIANGAKVDILDGNFITPLQLAAKNGHLHVMEFLLEKSADISWKNKNGETALHLAASGGHTKTIEFLLQKHFAVDSPTRRGDTALLMGVRHGHVAVVKLLKENGAQFDVKTRDKSETLLHIAALMGHTKIVELLLSAGVEKDSRNSTGDTPLHYGAYNGRLEVVRSLVNNDVNIDATNTKDETPLLLAVVKSHYEVVKFLLEADAKRHTPDHSGLTPLHIASRNNNYELVQLLLVGHPYCPALNFKTPLHYAARNGSIKIVKALVVAGSDVNATDDQNSTPLQVALHKHKIEVVKYLVENTQFDLNRTDRYGYSLLHLMIPFGLHLVKNLVEKGATVDIKHNNGITPLHCALSGLHEDIAKYLIQKGADINISNYNNFDKLSPDFIQYMLDRNIKITYRDDSGSTLLHHVAKKGYSKLVEALIAREGKVDVENSNRATPLDFALAEGHLQIAKILMKNGAKIASAVLHEACHNGHLEVVEFLITNGANIEAIDHTERTPLHSACDGGHLDVVQYLVKRGARLEKTDKRGWTATHFAANKGDVQIIKFLIENGADINAMDDKGYSPLFLTMEDLPRHGLQTGGGFLEAAEVILANEKTDISIKTKIFGHTILHSASANGYLKIVEFLINKGAPINDPDKHGNTPLDTAIYYEHEEVAAFLIGKGANVNVTNQTGSTPLHTAVSNESFPIVKLLVEKGAQTDAADNNGCTPLHIAVGHNNFDIVQFLVEKGVKGMINKVNEDGNNALHIAMKSRCLYIKNMRFARRRSPVSRKSNLLDKHEKLIEYLIANGIDYEAKNAKQQTPLDLAEKTRFQPTRKKKIECYHKSIQRSSS